MEALVFVLYTLLSGVQQGIVVWIFREDTPLKRSDWIHAALHYGGVLIYLVLVAYVEWVCWRFLWGRVLLWPALLSVLLHAALVRALLFDPVLNSSRSYYNHREGRAWGTLFEVGTVAWGDRQVHALALRLGWQPERLRLLLWLLTVAGAVGWYLWQH